MKNGKKMEKHRFYVTLSPVESADPARTIHLILKRPQASLSFSVFSVNLERPDGGVLVIPNRDYPYEGLSVLLNGENYHFIDGFAVGAKRGNSYVRLNATHVLASPWKLIYFYESPQESSQVSLSVEYYLCNLNSFENGTVGCMHVKCVNADSVVIEPLVDIRHMYDDSSPESHYCERTSDGMRIFRDDKCISISAICHDGCDVSVSTWHHEFEWWYKLGSGFRERRGDKIVFKGEIRRPVSLGEIEVRGREFDVIFACSNREEHLSWLSHVGRRWREDEREEEEKAIEICRKLGLCDEGGNNVDNHANVNERGTNTKGTGGYAWHDAARALRAWREEDAVMFRALALTKFGMYLRGRFFLEAGDFWFRTPWFRDQFEAILNNINTFMRIYPLETIERFVIDALSLQDRYGRVPNRFPGRENSALDYNSADATLLTFVVAGEIMLRLIGSNISKTSNFTRRSNRSNNSNNSNPSNSRISNRLSDGEGTALSEREFMRYVLERADFMIERFESNDVERKNGAPVIQANGLISVVPSHSWTEHWSESLIAKFGGEEEFKKPKFFLPEINALWIKMLRLCSLMCRFLESELGSETSDSGVSDSEVSNSEARNSEVSNSEESERGIDYWRAKGEEYERRLRKAKESFKHVFLSESGCIRHIVSLSGEYDEMPSSRCVVALALLLDERMFSRDEILRFFKWVKSHLLVKRKGVPFGILVRASSKNIYFGDEEYHEAVVWPRDTPYLLRFLAEIRTEEALEILNAILKSNLSHQMEEGFLFFNSELFSPDCFNGCEMTPVKNPVQLWSQWVDPFILYSRIDHFRES